MSDDNPFAPREGGAFTAKNAAKSLKRAADMLTDETIELMENIAKARKLRRKRDSGWEGDGDE